MKSTITLAMLVYNEAKYLPRVQQCLGDRINSVVIISDPPDNDGSLVLAKELFGHLNLKIIERPLPDVKEVGATMRNEVWQTAIDLYDDDYILWLDPDSPLIGSIPDELDQPLYAFYTKDTNSGISWLQPHLIRRDQTPCWKGAVHEWMDTKQTPVLALTTAIIERGGSGGGLKRMREWDLPTLLQEVKDNSDNPRSWYYLAQTYRDLGEYDKAIGAYMRRTQMYGFDQETFYSYYMIGCCYILKEEWLAAEEWLLKAHAYRPSRQEPVDRLIEFYERKGNLRMAIELIRNSHRMPPSNDILLVQNRPLPTFQ